MTTNYRVEIVSIFVDEIQYFKILDNANVILSKPRISRTLSRFNACFFDFDNYILHNDLNYSLLERLIESINKSLTKNNEKTLLICDELLNYIETNKYAISEHQIAGISIKAYDERWNSDIVNFNEIVNNEVSRPLLKQQVQASFFLAKMKCAANFSVPGAGKTAMTYGAFAYLSSKDINAVNKLLVVCPLNAFEAWRTEYELVFGNKRMLNFLNLREKKYSQDRNVKLDWGLADVIVINYEALSGKVKLLNELLDSKVMLVYDEVHRVKGVGGSRAKNALELGKHLKYRYVLTGTPIPNSYKDIYNFLHILYDREYDSFFGWDIRQLENPNQNDINEKLQPFFWRTTKKDLNVPVAEDDDIRLVKPSNEQNQLVDLIYENESNVLALYLRLLQASTNPSLLLKEIDYSELGLVEDEADLTQYTAITDKEKEIAKINSYKNQSVNSIVSNKFNEGIRLAVSLVKQNKKVLVWGMFVDTMFKIVNALQNEGVQVNIVYGGTPKEDREDLINEFRYGNVDVLVSNPNTLGEAISLHQTVHDAIYFEYNFNLTFMLQSRDRIHRLGLGKNQYTKYYYLMSEGDRAHKSFIDYQVYKRLKEKEAVMINAIEGEYLFPEVTDDILEEIKRIVSLQ